MILPVDRVYNRDAHRTGEATVVRLLGDLSWLYDYLVAASVTENPGLRVDEAGGSSRPNACRRRRRSVRALGRERRQKLPHERGTVDRRGIEQIVPRQPITVCKENQRQAPRRNP